MDVFSLRDRLVEDFGQYVRSFIRISDERIRDLVDSELDRGLLWPEPLVQLNPSFEGGGTIDALVAEGVLHEECRRCFRLDKDRQEAGRPLHLHRHQTDALRSARTGAHYVLTTGTGSGKSLAYIIPIVDHVLRVGSSPSIKAIVVYPMNALANSQQRELEKFLHHGYPDGCGPVNFARYTGQESEEQKRQIIESPPDILLTNYVMLELLLTRPDETPLVRSARGLQFLVLDELHTYRGRQGADVAMLVRRAREAFESADLQCVGTSATLASGGSLAEQRKEIAHMASRLFGARVDPQHVIGERLERVTPDQPLEDPAFARELRQQVADGSRRPPREFHAFVADPLSSFIESRCGVRPDQETGQLVRAAPRPIAGPEGVASELVRLTGLPADRCASAIAEQLLASYGSEAHPNTGFPVFAFRLHQFIGRGDTVYASLQPEDRRYLTVQGQSYVPGNRNRALLPLVFCRECGKEYYCVRERVDAENGVRRFERRELADQADEEDSEAGFLYVETKEPWPDRTEAVLDRLPEDWLEETRRGVRVRRDRRDRLPRPVRVEADATQRETGFSCHFFRAPFLFCLSCGVSYGARQRSDFAKLASLGTEGRSTATTILSLAAIRQLREDTTLEERARKILSFTDNRQDASLQAGHFNDFIEVGLLRSALYRAAESAGSEGLRHDTLVQAVFQALDLPLELYASDPEVKYAALEDTKRAFRSVLSYRLYRDLQRGWRITSPNLEQCGLLEIEYESLRELCENDADWAEHHPALASASPDTRFAIGKTLLDLMRRELVLKVDVLQPDAQERIVQQSSQRLRSPWAIEETELGSMERATILFPRTRARGDYRGHFYLSSRSGFAQYLGRSSTFPGYGERLRLEDREQICRDLLKALQLAGIVEAVDPKRDGEDVPGYQLVASALRWKAGDGARPFHDPIRVPRASAEATRPNPFFVEYYRTIAKSGRGLRAHEHTAQVPAPVREDREREFREGKLPILYCSPTMELGVDIAELNAVNLRNMPPTPANYAQRSGRAGRSGQPAIVFSYCTTYSPHDQYFFRRPHEMVSGAVAPPRIDLANEDLLRAHIHAIWLAETGVHLCQSLAELLDLSGDQPTLDLTPEKRDGLASRGARERARARAKRILEGIAHELSDAPWYDADWLDRILNGVLQSFEAACGRWRDLYRAAKRQQDHQHRIISDASRGADDKKKARRLRAEAESQLALLTEPGNVVQADFYSYRYFASEGFLPGYNFPRLPLSAFIPGRQRKDGQDEFVSRPRFLAISEFGPRAIVYHEGSRYLINRVMLTAEREGESDDIATTRAKLCNACGYLHDRFSDGTDGPDLCDRCGVALGPPLTSLFRLQNVSTRRRDKISSDEEERLRLGYDLKTGVRFESRAGHFSVRTARVLHGEEPIAELVYGDAARLWRINLGWRRRARKEDIGFDLDVERGYWARSQQEPDQEDPDDPLSNRRRRVVPYVEDHRNCLLVRELEPLAPKAMATLQATLKHAIQMLFQLEDAELSAEPLPSPDDRRQILLYEAAEGGAGVLRRLIDDPGTLARVARAALARCHFNPETGEDRRRAPGAREDCEAACYDCLMSYTNQPDHPLLDRQLVRSLLLRWAKSRVEAAPGSQPRGEHLTRLRRACDSDLERRWLDFLDARSLNLPTHAQHRLHAGNTRPDFLYDDHHVVIYVDGPHHAYPERAVRDRTQQERLEDAGYTVLRFGAEDDWEALVRRNPGIFGSLEERRP